MNGFIQSYQENFPVEDTTSAPGIMKCFSPEHLPVMTELAEEFGVFDSWYASVPGPTMVNRAYAGSATSAGMGTNDDITIAKGMSQKSVFRQLNEMGLEWKVYFQEIPSVLVFKDMRHKDARKNYRLMKTLKEDLATGNIPEFTWVEPGYFNAPGFPASDMHPDHDVSIGEQLVKDIYDSVRSSPVWNETALIITYDEHGGFYDHVSPPQEDVPNPDGINATDDPFEFTRLGVRIPTVVVSPWVKKGSVYHAPINPSVGQYDHTSIISTVVHKLFKSKGVRPEPSYLTKRDAWSATFEHAFDGVENVRTDCPLKTKDILSHQLNFPDSLPVLDGSLPLTHLQKELLSLCTGIHDEPLLSQDVLSKWTEKDGFDFCTDKMKSFLNE
jgi:phospholipase C